MNNRYKLPDDVKIVVLGFIKGQSRRMKQYKEKYSDIINGSTSISNQIGSNIQNNDIKSITEIKVLKLEKLNQALDTIIFNTIINCLNDVGKDLPLEIQEKLHRGIILNCNSKKYCYERLDLPTISRNVFYVYKNQFLYSIAKKLNLI